MLPTIRNQLYKLVLREYMNRGDLFGFFQLAPCILADHQIVELTANSAQQLAAIPFNRLLRFLTFKPVKGPGEKKRLAIQVAPGSGV